MTWPSWEPIPFQYFTEFADLSDAKEGTRQEWLRFHLGYRLAHCAIPAIVIGEGMARFGHWMQDRIMDWAERA